MNSIIKPKSIILLLILLSGCFLSGEAFASNLELTITSLKGSYLVGEPVFIDIALKNTSSTEGVKVSSEAIVETQYISLSIARATGRFQKYDPGFHFEPSRPLIELEPGNPIMRRQIVVYNAEIEDFAFPSEGVYRINAVYHRFGKAPDVKSNTIEIRISQPYGINASAMKLFKTKQVADLLMNISEESSAVRNLEILVTRYPNTIYGKYAQFYLARRQTREFFSRKPNHKRAVELYQNLIERDPSFPLASEIIFRLGISLYKTRNYGEAKKKLLLFMEKESKDALFVKRSEQILEKINRLEKKRK